MLLKKYIVLTTRFTLNISISLILVLTAFFTRSKASAQTGSLEPLPTTLIRRIDTSSDAWSPPSPDPAGIAYWPSRGTLLIADSEVDEIPGLFTGANGFESSLTGSLLSTCSTTNADRRGWSNEPTGVAINPDNDHVFFSDDSGPGWLHEVRPGWDGIYCTADDRVTTVGAPGNGDPEGIAYGENKLFIAGGYDRKVYLFDLGPDGVLGGGDDGPVTSFDTGALGFQDVEGIAYNPDDGTLFIVSTASNDQYIGEVSLTGELIRLYNLDYLGKTPRSGLAYGPSSWHPATKSIYLVSAGVDNERDPDENDGRIWEIHLGDIPANEEAPYVLDITLADPSPTAAASVQFHVSFSEAVTGVDAGDFFLSTTRGIRSAYISAVTGAGSMYTVTVATGSGNGTIRLDVVDRESIRDLDGNPLGGVGFNNGSFANGDFYEVHKGTILLDPASLDFEDSIVRNWSTVETVTISNAGAGPVQLGKLSIEDSETSGQVMFLMGNNCDNARLEAGASCTFRAAFRPITTGPVNGGVAIPSDALEQPQQVDLSGNGVCRFPFLAGLSIPSWLADWLCPTLLAGSESG